MSEYQWREEENSNVKEAIEWAEWLVKVKDPGPCLLAAKKHAETFLLAYYQMSAEISSAEFGTP